MAWIGMSDRVTEGNWFWESGGHTIFGGRVAPDVAAKANWDQGGGEPNGNTERTHLSG